MRDDSAEILSQSFLPEANVSSSDMGRDVHSLMLSITSALTTLRGALRGGFGGAVEACNVPEPCMPVYREGKNSGPTYQRFPLLYLE